MAFKDTWTDKVDGQDDVLAEDINSIAQELMRVGEEVDNGGANITVDQTYDSESKNPQSGVALSSEFDKKADRATTLSGYGITDAYTQEEVDSLISVAIGEALEGDY